MDNSIKLENIFNVHKLRTIEFLLDEIKSYISDNRDILKKKIKYKGTDIVISEESITSLLETIDDAIYFLEENKNV